MNLILLNAIKCIFLKEHNLGLHQGNTWWLLLNQIRQHSCLVIFGIIPVFQKFFLFDNVFTELMKKIKFLNQGANMRMTVFKVNIACQYLLKLLRFIQKILHCYNEMSSMHPNYKRHCSHCTSIQRTFWENLVPYLDFKHLQ